MRKKISLVIFLVIILFSTYVFADMGAPDIVKYKVSISKVGGAKYYGYDKNSNFVEKGTIEYGTEGYIDYEIEIKGITYGAFNQNDTLKYVNIKDTITIEDEFNINSNDQVVQYKEIKKATVLAKNGIKMHKGPVNGYSEVGETIPKGTELEFKYGAPADSMGSQTWIYVQYNGQEGWICILEGVVGFDRENTSKVITAVDTEIMEDGKVIAKIPANTVITDYYDVDMWSQSIYTTYNGVSGYVYIYDLGFNNGSNNQVEVVSKDVKLYESADINSDIKINIPIGTKLVCEYSKDKPLWIYVSYQGKEGWIISENEDMSSNIEYIADEAQVVPENKIDIDNNVITKENNNSSIMENIIESKEEKNNEKNNEESNILEKLSGMEIVWLCVGAAIIIAITALVTVILVNKKKKE